MAYGFTPEGLNTPTMSEIRDIIIKKFETKTGIKLYTAPDAVIGQFVDSIAECFAELWEQQQNMSTQIYPSTADGVMLDRAVSFTAVERKPSQYGTAKVIVKYKPVQSFTVPTGFSVRTIDNTSTWQTYSPQDIGKTKAYKIDISPRDSMLKAGASPKFTINGIEFNTSWGTLAEDKSVVEIINDIIDNNVVNFKNINAEAVSLGDRLHISFQDVNAASIVASEVNWDVYLFSIIEVVCTKTGVYAAPAGTLTSIATDTTKGIVLSCTNEEAAITGNNAETNNELRARYKQGAPRLNGGSTDVAIEQYILQYVNGCKDIRVYSNRSDVVDSMGRPPHAIHCVVSGGKSTDIAKALYSIVAGGIPYHGDYEVQVDEWNTVRFSRPKPRYVYIKLHVEQRKSRDEIVTPGIVDSLPETLAEYCENGHGIGTDVVRGWIEGFVYSSTKGIGLVQAKIAISDEPNLWPDDSKFLDDSDFNIRDDEYCVFSPDYIKVQ